LSLDLSCSEVTLGGVEFYAKLGDQTVTPVRAPVLRRDPTAAGARALRNNGTTVSFILPPAEKDQETVEVYYKSGTAVIPAYPEGDRLLLRGSAVFKDPPPRELRIWVVPIKVDGIIGTWGVGNASAVASQLQRDIPNMLPLAASQLQVRTRPTLTVRSATTFITSLGMLNRVAAELAAFRWLVSNHVAAPDFIVAVMPAGLVAGGEGASFAGRRRVLFVDEEHPDAAIHELGHGVGLYIDQEQYDKYPPNGALLGACTIFSTESAGANEIKHLPSERHNWFEKWCAYYDFMGCANPVWSSTEAIGTFHKWFADNLTSAKPMVKAAPGTTAAMAALNSGAKRLLVSGMVSERQPIPGTVRLFDLSRLDVAAEPLGGFGEYHFKAYDDGGVEIFSQPFIVQTAESEWVGTVDVPLATASCRIIKTYDNRLVPLDIGAAGLTRTKILSPALGDKVGKRLSITWQTSCDGVPEVDQVRHLLYFRTAANGEWESLVGPTTDLALETYSDMLPETTTLELRLVTSDGIDSVEDIVTGITVLPRLPEVTILSPAAGATSQTKTAYSRNQMLYSIEILFP